MSDIEKTDTISYMIMAFDWADISVNRKAEGERTLSNSAIAEWHIVARKGYHFSAILDVEVIEPGAL